MAAPEPFISVVIPLHVKGARFARDLEAVRQLNYPAYEILIVVDDPAGAAIPPDDQIRLLVTGQSGTGPAEKRDFALPHARGELVAFLDDDGYPDAQWLRRVVKYFDDPSVAIVGGPTLTPPEDGFWERVSGAVLESPWGSGPLVCRFTPRPTQTVKEHPGCNLFIRKELLAGVSGFDNTFYGGEDTLVCFKIAQRYGRKILCVPDVIVYHHRRALFGPFLRQMANCGLHRGYFFKRYPVTSRYVIYCLPPLGLLAALGILAAAAVWPWLAVGLAAAGAAIAAWITLVEWLGKRRPLAIAFWVPIGVALMHLTYGWAFVRGLWTRELTR